MDPVNAFKQSFQMDKDQIIRLGIALRDARKAKGLGLKDVGKAAGVSSQAVGQWERGENGPTMGKLIAVGKFLEIDVNAAMQGNVIAQPNPANSPAEVVMIGGPAYPDFGEYNIEVRGVAEGGRGSDFLFESMPSGRVRRPPGIKYSNGVSALHVVGDSASPRYEPGELIYVQKVPPRPGDWIVIEMYPEDDSDMSDVGQPTGKGFIKKYLRRTGSRLYCEQLNPKKEIEFDIGEIKEIYRVIPLKELMG